jgi:transposase
MARWMFSREFKVEAVRLVTERGDTVAQACRDLDVHENVLRRWVRELPSDPAQASPGHGQHKPEQLDVERLRREVAKLRAERDILRKAAALFAREANCGSLSLQRTGASGRRHGSAKRWTYPGRAFTPRCVAGRAPGRSWTRN